jgi:signal transduction histidine kinase
MARPWDRLSLKREVGILVPVSLLLLVALSTYTLFSYRNALHLLRDQEQARATRAARSLVLRLAEPGSDAETVLRQAHPDTLGAALLAADGTRLVAFGDLPPGDLLAELGSPAASTSTAVGPNGRVGPRVVGFASYGATPAARRFVRVDFASPLLASQLRGLPVLIAVVLGVDLGVLLLGLFFLRHLMAPFEALLDRARQVGPQPEAREDEVAFLVKTFEKALTALAQAEKEPTPTTELTALERLLTTSLETGMLLVDQAGQVVTGNAAGLSLLGLDEERLPQPLAQLLATEPDLLAPLETVLRTGVGIKRQEHLLAGRTLGYSAHVLRRDDGRERGLLVLVTDLTEVRRQESAQRLAEGMHQLGEMAAGVAHELRNSVATLAGYLTLIERRPDAGSFDDYLGEVRREVQHLRRVVEDFLAFARPGTARREAVDLLALARRVAADPSLPPGAVRLASRVSRASLPGDAQLLERALRNLVLNAVEAQHQGSSASPVELVVADEAGAPSLSVLDRGPGLPAEIRERLFQPFVTGRSDGVGLGLALAYRIVGLHQGQLELLDREGGGTEARVSFPGGNSE